jgi:uncharacterized protein (TIGR03067 family)
MQESELSSVIASDLAILQGTWTQIACDIDGVKNPAEEYGSQPRVTFTGFEYVVIKQDGAIAVEGHFELYPKHTPKAVDWSDTFGTDAGMTLPAIYFLEGNRFVFCVASEGQTRPTEFSSARGRIIRVHERIQP